MEIIQNGMSGTMESSDINILIQPNLQKGIIINLKSAVEKQFGNKIREVIRETLKKLEISDAIVTANDKGALDYAIIARVECAACRAAGKEKNLKWEGL
ncbi:citrate lyase acyl carrier protein [Clostridium sediminicola]|uniref:citrate lyase acyl carrier protein n=1 Tax=Clostridium sediminicola TaxID=3114879 RepID=UPI0031F21EBF